MKPIHVYPSMSAAVHELGTDGFVSALLRSQRPTCIDGPKPIWRVAAAAWAPTGRALVGMRPEHDSRTARP
jgi:hypothetical protein